MWHLIVDDFVNNKTWQNATKYNQVVFVRLLYNFFFLNTLNYESTQALDKDFVYLDDCVPTVMHG